ncbi:MULTISPECIES: Flp family type IVb pilin [Hyphomonas]|jgi:pilus assembly protein Flp/PilA|uniref:Flp family type IVb pilin n=1 Tax=Hyphomonas adhaerens TaxID=81029 RepID=A0A3B9GX56_9PROT|nr:MULTISPECIES: Flp family type IVb pilin [Hyphomonas]MBB41141.1 Flp family type IVb pilin [Hyphomonas sp.]HAE27049.1 Flp family type IVb pilin [Hyphomonas adhaerens]|tara:strand:- start:263 stop:439 length:177 start_codon:yes stop_codon:yes gene_type:complete
MRVARELFQTFLGDENGATAIEYALIAGMICLAIVGGATAVGTTTNDSFTKAADGFPD